MSTPTTPTTLTASPAFIVVSAWDVYAAAIDAAQAAHRRHTAQRSLVIPNSGRCPFCNERTTLDPLRPGVVVCTECHEPVAFIA